MKINIDGRDYSFKFTHHTGDTSPNKLSKKDSQIERSTVCRVFNEDGKIVTYGVANVHPYDNFCKETGRKIALSRAISTWEKEYKTLVWDEYRTWGKNRW